MLAALTLFDWLALGLIALSMAVSVVRGVVAEVASLLTWIVAFVAAKLLAVPVAEVAFGSVQPPALAAVAGFVLVFVAAWLAQYFLRSLLTAAVAAVGLGGVNRLLGALFGAVRGVLLVTLAVLVCAFTDLPKTPEWRQAQTASAFEGLALLAVPYLPPFVAEQLAYPSGSPAVWPAPAR